VSAKSATVKPDFGAFPMVALGGKPKGLPAAHVGLSTRQAQPPLLTGWQTQVSCIMQNTLIPISAIALFDGEPRIRDIDLAEGLGFERPRKIRDMIARNTAELLAYGGLPRRGASPGRQGGRPSSAYYLNEGQALVICALSRTDRAAEIRKAIIDVFMAYRQGKLVDVSAHYRRPPSAPARSLPQTDFRLVGYPSGMAEIWISVPLHCAAPIMQAYAEIRH